MKQYIDYFLSYLQTEKDAVIKNDAGLKTPIS